MFNLFKQTSRHSASKYFIVGVSAFTVDYLMFLLTYYILAIPLKIATAVGFIAGFGISFSVNKKWVFGGGKQHKKIVRQLIEYSLLVIFNLALTVWAVSFLSGRGVAPFIGKLMVMGAIMCWNYVLFRWAIFAKASPE